MEDKYRYGILGIIVNNEDKFLIVNLVGYKDNEWNFPGGGLEEHEKGNLEDALFRELKEELGIKRDEIEIIGKSKNYIKYDFPKDVIERNKLKGWDFKGQIKEQFVVRFNGNDEDIILQEEEVNKYKWVSKDELKNHLLFPRQLENALNVLDEFKI